MSKFKDFVERKEDFNCDSQTLFNEMAILNPNSLNKIRNAIQFIHQNNIKCVLVGGMSVSHYVADRKLTPDVDLLTVDIENLKQILQEQNVPYSQLAGNEQYEGITVPQFDADFLDANAGNAKLNHYILQTAVNSNIAGVSIPVIDPCVLTIMKFEIGRDKDTDDAFKLLPTLDKNALKVHLTALKGDLRTASAKEIWQYAKVM